MRAYSDLGGDSVAELFVGSGSGCIVGHTKGSQDAGWGVGIRETSGERRGTAGGGLYVALGPCRGVRDSEPSLTGEPEGAPQRLTSELWKGTLCSSAPRSIVVVSVQPALIDTSI